MKNIRNISLLLPTLLMAAMLTMYGCGDPEPVTPEDPGTEDPGGEEPGDKEKSATCDLKSIRIEKTRNGLSSDIVFTLNATTRMATGTYIKWIDNTDPEMLIPSFEHTGEKVVVKGVEVVSTRTKISFAEDVSLIVVAENGRTKTYTIRLICPQINTELAVLRLEPDKVIDSKEVYVNTWLDMYSAKTSSGWWNSSKGQIEVRGRGNSTWGDADKRPYRLKFPEKFSPLGLNHANDKNWVIIANDSDKSFMRNEMAFAFSRVLFNAAEGWHDPKAILFTPCSQFVNVYMNDDYIGVYQMSDHMQRDPGRIAVEKLTKADGNDPDLITGGYILETDVHANTGPDRFNSSHGIQINRKYPEDDDFHPDQYAYIAKFVNDMEAVLYGSNFKDKTNGWRKYLDEKTLADFVIMKEFAADADGFTSTYCYKRRGVDKLFFGPGWDFDKGWDNENRIDNSNPTYNLMINVGFGMPGRGNGKDWYQRLWEDESFRATVKARWASKRNELLAAAMKVLDEKPQAMSKSVKANFTRWPFWDPNARMIWGSKAPAANYELEIERVRTLTNTRATALDGLFQ